MIVGSWRRSGWHMCVPEPKSVLTTRAFEFFDVVLSPATCGQLAGSATSFIQVARTFGCFSSAISIRCGRGYVGFEPLLHDGTAPLGSSPNWMTYGCEP